MTKLIPFLKNLRIATVKKWVYEERRDGSRTGRLFREMFNEVDSEFDSVILT